MDADEAGLNSLIPGTFTFTEANAWHDYHIQHSALDSQLGRLCSPCIAGGLSRRAVAKARAILMYFSSNLNLRGVQLEERRRLCRALPRKQDDMQTHEDTA
jgi:hypothetical protein